MKSAAVFVPFSLVYEFMMKIVSLMRCSLKFVREADEFLHVKMPSFCILTSVWRQSGDFGLFVTSFSPEMIAVPLRVSAADADMTSFWWNSWFCDVNISDNDVISSQWRHYKKNSHFEKIFLAVRISTRGVNLSFSKQRICDHKFNSIHIHRYIQYIRILVKKRSFKVVTFLFY